MEDIILFFEKYGLATGLIALAGIIILGIMKYCELFKKYDEAQRHSLYLVISVGLSAIGSAIYLAAIGQFEAKYFTALLLAIYGLNQTFYSIFANLSLNDLIARVLDKTIEKLSEKK